MMDLPIQDESAGPLYGGVRVAGLLDTPSERRQDRNQGAQ